MWPISAGTELSPAFIVLCSSFNAFLMEFSEGEHRQPSSAGMEVSALWKQGRKLNGNINVGEEAC